MSWFSDLFNAGVDTTSQTTEIPAWMQSYMQNYAQTAQNVAAMPYQAYQGQTVSDMNPLLTQGLNAQAARAVQGSPVMDAASGELQKTLSGGYLNNNPYLSGMIDRAGEDVTRAYAPIDARSGSFGNSGVNFNRNKAFADAALGYRFNDYSQERNRMQNAVGQAPSIANQDYIDANALQTAGRGFQQQNQAQLDDQFKRFQEAQAYPYKQLQTLGSGVGMNTGQTTTLQTPGTSPLATGLGTAASLYSAQKAPTVICTELHRQGFMSDEVYALDQAYGSLLVKHDPAVYAGYIRLATPVVERMKRSKNFSYLVSILAKPWAQEMAYQMGHGKTSYVGKLIMAIGYPLCRMAAKEVAYG